MTGRRNFSACSSKDGLAVSLGATGNPKWGAGCQQYPAFLVSMTVSCTVKIGQSSHDCSGSIAKFPSPCSTGGGTVKNPFNIITVRGVGMPGQQVPAQGRQMLLFISRSSRTGFQRLQSRRSSLLSGFRDIFQFPGSYPSKT
jgi:hypothetical protein